MPKTRRYFQAWREASSRTRLPRRRSAARPGRAFSPVDMPTTRAFAATTTSSASAPRHSSRVISYATATRPPWPGSSATGGRGGVCPISIIGPFSRAARLNTSGPPSTSTGTVGAFAAIRPISSGGRRSIFCVASRTVTTLLGFSTSRRSAPHYPWTPEPRYRSRAASALGREPSHPRAGPVRQAGVCSQPALEARRGKDRSSRAAPDAHVCRRHGRSHLRKLGALGEKRDTLGDLHVRQRLRLGRPFVRRSLVDGGGKARPVQRVYPGAAPPSLAGPCRGREQGGKGSSAMSTSHRPCSRRQGSCRVRRPPMDGRSLLSTRRRDTDPPGALAGGGCADTDLGLPAHAERTSTSSTAAEEAECSSASTTTSSATLGSFAISSETEAGATTRTPGGCTSSSDWNDAAVGTGTSVRSCP